MNEVTIFIKAKNEATAVIATVRKQVKGLGNDAGGTAKSIGDMGDASTVAAGKQAKMGGATREVTREVGKQSEKVDDLSRKLRRVSTGTYNVKVDVDKDGRLNSAFGKITGFFGGLVETAGGAAEKIGKDFIDVLPGAIGGAFSAAGPIVQTALVAIGAIVVAALASFVAAGLAAGILAALGGGVLAAGIAGALKTDKIDEILNGKKVVTRSALNAKGDKTPNFGQDQESREGGLIPKVEGIFESFSQPFVDPLSRALEAVDKALDRIGPKAADLGAKFAPIVDKLAPALMEMAERAWPGISAALDQSMPLFDTLAGLLPPIGEAINLFFQTIADHGPAANEAFGQIVGIVGTLIVALATVLGWLLKAYENFMKLKDALSGTWVGSLFAAPIHALEYLIGLLDSALGKKHALEGGGGQARTLGEGAPAGISRGALARASGGIAGGLTQVAERGGELIKLPQGSMVYANGQSNQMLQQAGQSSQQTQVIRFEGDDSALWALFKRAMRAGELQVPASAIV